MAAAGEPSAKARCCCIGVVWRKCLQMGELSTSKVASDSAAREKEIAQKVEGLSSSYFAN